MPTHINLNGRFYSSFLEDDRYTTEQRRVIENTVEKLVTVKTSFERPGMLLGRIQSGKTASFIRISALAFDNGFDLTVVLTKGTRALTKQTTERLGRSFQEFLGDHVQMFDIMSFRDDLVGWVLRQKMILVAKKETNNLRRLIEAVTLQYPILANRKTLIIDDEADYASVGFRRSRDEGIRMSHIGKQIQELREVLSQSSFLQVTATPYSLYLQPTEIVTADGTFCPIRPAFTGSLPAYEGYVGGDFYFRESSSGIASYIFHPVDLNELNILRESDRRSFKIEDALKSSKIVALRTALINFITGGSIRRIQQSAQGDPIKKYSFVVHTESGKGSHKWQLRVVSALLAQLKEAIEKGDPDVTSAIIGSYNDLARSFADDPSLPQLPHVREAVIQAILEEHIMVTTVNSDKEVEALLDSTGQLHLSTPLNIFIGGQILDRGITIGNMIGFYYGRRPNRFQQDTVLQHSRMYGARPIEDLKVTRFYSSAVIYDAMARIHEMDAAMREAVESGSQEVVFIRTDPTGRVVPCSPNKILASTTTTLKPHSRLLPVGFQSGFKTNVQKQIASLDERIGTDGEREVDLHYACRIVRDIFATYELEDYDGVSAEEMESLLAYLATLSHNVERRGKVVLLVRTGRTMAREKADSRLENAPDSVMREGRIAKQLATDVPVLVLLRQDGEEEQGWNGYPFWWPVIYAPQITPTSIHARDVVSEEQD